jgi:hypothetical protein
LKFGLMVEVAKLFIVPVFHMGSILQPVFESTCLRSACLLIGLRKLYKWQTSKLNHAVAVQHMTINHHELKNEFSTIPR